jgi:hypothetical protein
MFVILSNGMLRDTAIKTFLCWWIVCATCGGSGSGTGICFLPQFRLTSHWLCNGHAVAYPYSYVWEQDSIVIVRHDEQVVDIKMSVWLERLWINPKANGFTSAQADIYHRQH